jgi:predicted xylose isomerase-like sugar epimerase
VDLSQGLTLEQYRRMEGNLKRPLTDDPMMTRAERARMTKPAPEESENMIELRRLLGLSEPFGYEVEA